MLGVYQVRSHRMYTKHGGFPYVHYSPTGDIVVEVYAVDDDNMMMNLDNLEGYPYHYQRKVVPYFDHSRARTPAGRAWMYYVTDKGLPSEYVNDGDWANYIFQPKQWRSI